MQPNCSGDMSLPTPATREKSSDSILLGSGMKLSTAPPVTGIPARSEVHPFALTLNFMHQNDSWGLCYSVILSQELLAALKFNWDNNIPTSMNAQPTNPRRASVSPSISQPPRTAKTASRLRMIAA